jgi:asparagine synthase (glutamine-hydrolysing)
VSVAVRNETEELAHAEALASEFGWKLEVALHKSDDVPSYLRRVLWLIEEPNLMKLSVAIPLHWSAEYASRKGPSIIITGQGSDELFGGYRKFAFVLGSKGRLALDQELLRAVLNSHDVNFARDEKAVSPFPVELRSVFTMQQIVHLGLRIPSSYKVRSGNDDMRKWILRRVGELLGLPSSVTGRRKRAIQHATGVEKEIRALAKSHGKDVDLYLSELHKELLAEENLPSPT